MNTRFIPFIVSYLLLGFLSTAHAQLKKACETCFTSEITRAVKNGNHCMDYEITVSYAGRCEHALSHFTVAIPKCATVKNVLNTHHCSQSTGYDPTTGLTGIQIDNISGFGESSVKSIVVSFTLCSDASCTPANCWRPLVAYKAGNCFELDTLGSFCPTLKVRLEKKNASCFGIHDGQLTALVDEGKAPFQYLWSTGATTTLINQLGTGTYSVTITDATGTRVSVSDSITQPSAISLSGTIMDATCDGLSNGAISVSVTGGAGGPYSFLWNNGAVTKDLTSIKAGTYSVVAKDSAGCSAQASFTIKNLKQITAAATTSAPGCNQSNGAIDVTAGGGTGPYTYSWSTGAATPGIAGLQPGSYSLTITDSAGCSLKVTYFLRENNTLRLSFAVTPTSCVDDSSGMIKLSISGGTVPYSFSWSNAATTKDISGLTAGSYTVTVSDSIGCKISTRITVPKNTFQVSSQITQPKCFADSTGTISVIPSGGVEPYQFSWSTGATSSSIANLPKGTYTVTIVDGAGCSRISTFVITGPSELKSNTSVNAVSCNEYSIDLTIAGGTSPYQYQWSTGAVTQDISGLSPGIYSVSVTDVNGCHLEKPVSIDSVASWTCLILPPVQPPVCLSQNNVLSTSISDADSYAWQITSSDSTWTVQGGSNSDSLVYMAGQKNTAATFTLTMVKGGCTQSCSYTISACSSSNEPPENCNDCFRSRITLKSKEGSCSTYSMKVFTDGYCRHDLSHFVIAIPCGSVSHYSNTGQWPMVVGKDPTTSLTGLKVDDIKHFGEDRDAFTLVFTICSSQDCADSMKRWHPVVSFKAGQCVSYDTLEIRSGSFSACAYPNPFRNSCQLEVDSDDDDYVRIEICDQFGKTVMEGIECPILSGERKTIVVDGAHLRENLYIYKIRGRDKTTYGKLFKIN